MNTLNSPLASFHRLVAAVTLFTREQPVTSETCLDALCVNVCVFLFHYICTMHRQVYQWSQVDSCWLKDQWNSNYFHPLYLCDIPLERREKKRDNFALFHSHRLMLRKRLLFSLFSCASEREKAANEQMTLPDFVEKKNRTSLLSLAHSALGATVAKNSDKVCG